MNLKRLTRLIVCALLGGCVILPEPVGQVPAVLEPEDWEGYWISSTEDDVVYAVVTDRQRGTLEMSGIEKEAPENGPPRARLERLEALVRVAGEVLLLSVPVEKEPGYVFFALKKEGDQVTLSFPDAKCVKALIEGGTLSGSERSPFTIALDRLDPVQAVSQAAPMGCNIFDWDKTVVFRRLRKQARHE